MNLDLIYSDDWPFVNERLSSLPEPFQKHVLADYLKDLEFKSRREANLGLIKLTEATDSAITHRLNRGGLNFDENDLKALSKIKADHCLELYRLISSKDKEIAYKQILSFIKDNGIEPSFIKENPADADMNSLIRRSLNPTWWHRQLRRVQNRDIEITARELNLVSSARQIYISDLNHQRHQQQKREQKSYLENMLAENEEGDVFLLSELQESSVSNPYVKKSELMVRCRGFENLAQSLGHAGVFITITCPSRYHKAYKNGATNPKHDGSSPNVAQTYLQGVWARIRASLDRQDIRVYGFRVVEPHHDGTPHWHLLFFVEPESIEALNSTFLRYCLEEDADEKGAMENRVKFINIDPNKGSATGYIAKYVAKNINGEDLESGIYGENPVIAAERVTAWASVWGIRQFQQIGGAPVSPWRELRRLEQSTELESLLEQARLAADKSDWEGYQEAMGGVDCPKADRPISIVYWNEVDTDTGEMQCNQYGELKAPSIYGLKFNDEIINTRPHLWKIYRA